MILGFEVESVSSASCVNCMKLLKVMLRISPKGCLVMISGEDSVGGGYSTLRKLSARKKVCNVNLI